MFCGEVIFSHGSSVVPARTTEVVQSGGERALTLLHIYTVYVLSDNIGKLYKGMDPWALRGGSVNTATGRTRTTAQMTGLRVIHKEISSSVREASRKRKVP